MHHDLTKYFYEAHLRLQSLTEVWVSRNATIDLDELCEEIWLSADKGDASCVLESYADIISNYSYELLCEVLFGLEIKTEYEELKFSNLEKLHHILDRILF